MNKVKTFMAFIGLLFLCACSESDKLAGTAVEPNELAERDHDRNRDPESSSSERIMENLSSSSEGNQNGIKDESSSSLVRDAEIGLSNYAEYYGVLNVEFDDAVLASTVVYDGEKVSAANPIQTPDDTTDTQIPGESSAVTELNSPGLHEMTDRLDALHAVFRESADTLIALGKKASAEDPSCGTYLYNVRGQSGAIGQVLVGVASDTLTVIDIVAKGCSGTEGKIVGFVFIYCGEMERMPYEKRETLVRDPSAGKCPNVDPNYEWTN